MSGNFWKKKQMQRVELHHSAVLTGIRAFNTALWVKVCIIPALGSVREKDPVFQASLSVKHSLRL